MTHRPILPYALIAPAVAFLAVLFLVPLVADHRAGLPRPAAPGSDNYARMARRPQLRDRRSQHLPARARRHAAAARARARHGDDAAEARTRPRPRAVDLDDPARRLRPRRGPRLARDPAGLAATSTRVLFALGADRWPADLAQLRNAGQRCSSRSWSPRLWRATAIVLVILVAGLQLIPKEYGEAAEVFGATPWQRFRKITLPLLKPSHPVGADPAHGAGLRGFRGRLCAGRAQLPGARRRGLSTGSTTTRTTASPPPMRC